MKKRKRRYQRCRFPHKFTASQVASEVYQVATFDQEIYFNLGGVFVKEKNLIRSDEKEKSSIRIVTASEIYDQIYKGYGFKKTSTGKSQVICKRKFSLYSKKPLIDIRKQKSYD